MGLKFDGMDELLGKLSRMEVSTDKVAESALVETHQVVTEQVDKAQASSRYNLVPGVSGATSGAVYRDMTVDCSGTTASSGVGWSIADGGLPSVFLMYGTPSIAPDRNLYNAIYGGKTKQLVQQAQADTMLDFLIDGGVR
ncbi:MAG: hypothetical protein RR842_13525 [Gordonibacter sp.]|uniref:hypothetical protein n=1 Tax=Gordonibacter sp. TaxID=1968902 RepID=UPI002FCBB317